MDTVTTAPPKKKKDLIGKEMRVVIWGVNEYDHSRQCHAESFQDLDTSPRFYFREGAIVYELKVDYKKTGFRHTRDMTKTYVFNLEGVCISHRPRKRASRSCFDSRPGELKAEIIFTPKKPA